MLSLLGYAPDSRPAAARRLATGWRILVATFTLAHLSVSPVAQSNGGPTPEDVRAATRTVALLGRSSELLETAFGGRPEGFEGFRRALRGLREEVSVTADDYAIAAQECAAHAAALRRRRGPGTQIDWAEALALAIVETGSQRFRTDSDLRIVRCQLHAERVTDESRMLDLWFELLRELTPRPWSEWTEMSRSYALDDIGEGIKNIVSDPAERDRALEELQRIRNAAARPNPGLALIHADAAARFGRHAEATRILVELLTNEASIGTLAPLYLHQLLEGSAGSASGPTRVLETYDRISSLRHARNLPLDVYVELARARLRTELGDLTGAAPVVLAAAHEEATSSVRFNVAELCELIGLAMRTAGLNHVEDPRFGRITPERLFRRARRICDAILDELADEPQTSAGDRLTVQTVLGRTLSHLGEFELSAQVLEATLREHEQVLSDPPLDVLLALGDLYMAQPTQEQDTRRARLAFERYLALFDDPMSTGSAEIRARLARIYAARGEYAAAIGTSSEALRQLRRGAVRLQYARRQAGGIAASLPANRESSGLDREMALLLASCQYEVGRTTDALASLRDCLDRHGEDEDTLLRLATLEYQANDPVAAYETLRRIAVQDSPAVLVLKARIDQQQGFPDRALEALETALELDSSSFDARFYFGRIAADSEDPGQQARGVAALEALLRDTFHPRVRIALGDHHRRRAEWSSGSDALESTAVAREHYRRARDDGSVQSDPRLLASLDESLARIGALEARFRAEREGWRLVYVVSGLLLLVVAASFFGGRHVYRLSIMRRVIRLEQNVRSLLAERVETVLDGNWSRLGQAPFTATGRFPYSHLEKRRHDNHKRNVAEIATLGQLVAAMELGWDVLGMSPDRVRDADRSLVLAQLNYVNESRRPMMHAVGQPTGDADSTSVRGMNRRVDESIRVLHERIQFPKEVDRAEAAQP